MIKFEEHIDIDGSFHAAAYHRQLKRLKTSGAVAPFTLSSPSCAVVCVRALTAKRPKARYRVTFPTVLFWYLKRVLPTSALDYFSRKAVEDQGK